MTMIEKIARALCTIDGCDPLWQRYERQARAAIEAMREPTEEMTRMGHYCAEGCTDDPCGKLPQHVWGTMIKAALSEKPGARS